MAQQFQADAVVTSAAVNVPTTTETVIVTGNPLTPPYGSFKAKVEANVLLTVGTSTTTITLKLKRNTTAENVTINSVQNITTIAGNTVQVSVNAVDQVNDGRQVQYALTITQNGATANGSALAGAYIETTLLSG